MSHDTLEDELPSPHRDVLKRPLPSHLVPEMPSAGDMMLAGFSQRFIAFCVDMMIISLLFCGILFLLIKNDVIISATAITTIFSVLWGGYTIVFSVSARHATIGQRVTGIHLYSLFSHHISFMVALVRFAIFAAPTIVMLYMTMHYITEYVPTLSHQSDVMPEAGEATFFLVMTVAGLAQLLMLWPLISGHYRRVVWDSSLRCAVVRKRIF